ncbi:MAG: hypothetical protein FJZ87_18070 [Chloroflexi bacterium]|nr:hypothetical protein [Chloroflexota bacterium]
MQVVWVAPAILHQECLFVNVRPYLRIGCYYVVFNWGDGVPDNNSTVGDIAGSETDNQNIPYSELYGSPIDTGILIDVDNAPSYPPAGNYSYLAVQAPIAPPSDGADVDSVQIVDIPSPYPTP